MYASPVWSGASCLLVRSVWFGLICAVSLVWCGSVWQLFQLFLWFCVRVLVYRCLCFIGDKSSDWQIVCHSSEKEQFWMIRYLFSVLWTYHSLALSLFTCLLFICTVLSKNTADVDKPAYMNKGIKKVWCKHAVNMYTLVAASIIKGHNLCAQTHILGQRSLRQCTWEVEYCTCERESLCCISGGERFVSLASEPDGVPKCSHPKLGPGGWCCQRCESDPSQHQAVQGSLWERYHSSGGRSHPVWRQSSQAEEEQEQL